MPNRPTKVEQYFRRRILTRNERFIEIVRGNYPPLLVARFAVELVHAVEGLCGAEFWACFAEQQAEVARQRGGFCQHCDAECDPSETHPFVCELCDRRLDREIADIMGDEP